MKKYFIFGLFLFFILLSTSVVFAVDSLNYSKVDPEIVSSLNANPEAGVIVQLKNESISGIIFKTKIDADQIKDDVILSIGGEDEIDYEFSLFNGFSANISSEDLSSLSKNNLVEKVYLNREFKSNIYDSVPLINASLLRPIQINGINLTGKGQTICIIDTGVTYTHPDLGGCYGNNDPNSSCRVLGGYDFVNSDADPLDDNGHGTHVAGIAASNGGRIGVAPEAKIVAIKSLNNLGSGSDLKIFAGIEWCVDNATRFNISVISMSLGIDCNTYPQYCYSNYCDNQPAESLYRDYVNYAYSKNISIVAATGNQGSTTSFSSPACIQNATRVGATNKDDTLASYTNRGANFDIYLAPGTNINSLSMAGGYTTMSGTSMATPHVAGIIALMNQFLSLNSLNSKFPKDIKTILNNTGKIIFDSSTNKNYTRVNAYSSVISLDARKPSVNLTYPQNGMINVSRNLTFYFNVSDFYISNLTFVIWNYVDQIINQTTFIISNSSVSLTYNVSLPSFGSYKWNVFAYDLNSNLGSSGNNFTFSLGNLSSSLISPHESFSTNIPTLNFSCLTETSGLNSISNMTFFIWNSSSLLYSDYQNVTGYTNVSYFNYSFLEEGSYFWNCLAMDNLSTSEFSASNNSIFYDLTPPIVSLISPDNLYSYSSNEQEISFQSNISDNFGIGNCSLLVDEIMVNNKRDFSSISEIYSFTKTFVPSTYSWRVNCSDSAGNFNQSELRFFSVNALAQTSGSSRSSGGGGGAASSGNIYTLSTDELARGNSKYISSLDKIKFSLGAESHVISVAKINLDSVIFTVASTPFNVTLTLGEIKKLNLTSNLYYDLYIHLNSFNGTKVNISIKNIYEPIILRNVTIFENTSVIFVNSSVTDSKKEVESKFLHNEDYEFLIPLLSILFLIIAYIILRRDTLKEEKKYKSSKTDKVRWFYTK